MQKQIIRLPEVVERYGLSKATIYRQVKKGRFPAPVSLTEKLIGWRQEDLDQWAQGLAPSGEAAGGMRGNECHENKSPAP
ncbi:MAG: AlpA family phage regulatory protein [Candidatus Competibacteraceae bacterium]